MAGNASRAVTPMEVAAWLAAEIETLGKVRQESLDHATAVAEIERRFGSDFLYDTQARNKGIKGAVLEPFRKLHAGTIERSNGYRDEPGYWTWKGLLAARWILWAAKKEGEHGRLLEWSAAAYIEAHFGNAFVFVNDKGKVEVVDAVVAVFDQLAKGDVDWFAREKAWAWRPKGKGRSKLSTRPGSQSGSLTD